MNTCSRRFLLRIIVGVLTFAIGVGAAMLFGGFSPFRSYSFWTNQGYRYDGYHRHSRLYADETTGAMPATIPLKGPNGIRVRTELRELPTVPPATDAPAPPTPPVGRR